MSSNQYRTMTARHIFTVIAGCGLIGTSFGICVSISGNFFAPLAQSFGVGRGQAAMTLTIYNIIQGIAALFAPAVLSRMCFRKILLLGTALQFCATFLLSQCTAVYQLYVLNTLRGIGSGMTGTVLVTMMINYWFCEQAALMVSIPLGFSGIVSALLSPFIARVISTWGWRNAYAVSACLILALNLPALTLPISLHPEDVNRKPYGMRGDTDTVQSMTIPKPSVLLLGLILLFSALCSIVSALPPHFAGISEHAGFAMYGAWLISASMISNTSGKVLFGALSDCIGSLRTSSVFLLIVAAAGALFLFVPNPPFLVIAAFLFGLCLAVSIVGTAAISREMFGINGYRTYYPAVNLCATLANAFGTWLIGFMYDLSGSYDSGIILTLILMVLSLVTLYLIRHFSSPGDRQSWHA